MHRREHIFTIIADLGDIFTFIAPITCIPLIVTLIYSEWDMFIPMAAVPVTFYVLGMLLASIPRSERVARLSTALCSVALFWLTCAMVSGIPSCSLFIWVLPTPCSRGWPGGPERH